MEEGIKTWSCGFNIKATLKGNTLIISGEGYMVDYEDYAPWYKESILNIIIEDGVTNIGKNAFNNCIGIKSITIGNSVKSIEYRAFYNCLNLKEITIPKNVTEIGNSVFQYCENLSSVTFESGVVKLGDDALRNCTNLKTIILPESIRDIGQYFVWWSKSLSTIVNYSLVPQIISFHTFNQYYNYELYVPRDSIELYKSALFWKEFKTILAIEDMDNGLDSVDISDIDNSIREAEDEIKELEQSISNLQKKIEELQFRKLLMRGLEGNPKDVADFMSLFNQRDGLKYLTHDIDENGDFDLANILSNIKQVLKSSFEEMEIPLTLKKLINEFAIATEPKWTSFDNQYNEQVISSGWSLPQWEEDANNSKIHPIRTSDKMDVIRSFKRTTRVESPYLETIVDKIFNDADFEIDTKDLSKADFYTHVGEFMAALNTIFEEIKKRGDSDDKKNVSVEYQRGISEDYFVRKIVITHHNSFPNRNDKDALTKEWLSLNKGNMGKIAEHLQGYCHWSVETNIDDSPVRVNILREEGVEPIEDITGTEVKGFSHILTFYYQS